MSNFFNFLTIVPRRSISLSAAREGKRNFKKFPLPNKRGTRLQKLRQASDDPELPIDRRGVRDVGYQLDGRFVTVPEMIPEIIVPDLKGCELKPYVSYKAADVVQSQFTSEQLFDAVYSKKIVEDFRAGKLDAYGDPLSPSDEEKLSPREAVTRAKKTGSDIF